MVRRRVAPRDRATPRIRGDFAVCRGRPGDAATILRLIRGLARFERLADQVKATVGRIHRDGFGRRRYFETMICRRGSRTVGFALYFFTYSTFLARPSLYLEDLFVLPAERGNGAGHALLHALAKIAVARGCGRMEWAVLDWNRSAIRFYRRLGARLHREWVLTRLTGASLERLAGRESPTRSPITGEPVSARARPSGERLRRRWRDRRSS
jgi:GNAT superfamily N-acetyltransferase